MDAAPHLILERAEERLWIGDKPVQLSPVAFRLLLLFVQSDGRLVTKRRILREVWPDTTVSDASVKDVVKNLRATLGDSASKPIYLETVRGRGYRFLGGIDVVERVGADATPQTEPSSAAVTGQSEPVLDNDIGGLGLFFVRRWKGLALAVSIAVAVAILTFDWRAPDDPEPARAERIAFALPEKPSIAVMPFVNLSGDDGVDWISTGLSSNVITTLASSPDMFVISQNALDAMAGAKPGEIAERYGVRFVLEGTIQVDGEKLRVTARLADAIEGRAMWSNKWDKQLDDIFQIQDEIAEVIFEELQVRLTLGEQARSWRASLGTPENMRDMVVGRVAFQTFTPEGHAQVKRLWEDMYARDPELPISIGLLGWLSWHKVVVGLSADPVADLNAAKDWAQKSIDAGLGGNTHVLYATAANYLGQTDLAIEYAEQGVRVAPGEADVVMIAGSVFAMGGRLEEGIHLMKKGMRLEPDYPDWLAGRMVNALVKAGRWQEARPLAIEIGERDVPDVNAKFGALISLVVMSVWENDIAEARRYLAELRDLRPGLTVSQFADDVRYLAYTTHIEEPGYLDRYLAALRVAGLPEGE